MSSPSISNPEYNYIRLNHTNQSLLVSSPWILTSAIDEPVPVERNALFKDNDHFPAKIVLASNQLPLAFQSSQAILQENVFKQINSGSKQCYSNA